ncbi:MULTISPECIES: Shedu immune nuclease family protein [unclassified Mesorhizobium]|uniref:Shedu immune nuclease family protein n=1 Tax=unclassified Mesorhizobium TaxID=325217 RepID=UPI00333B318C
MSSDVEYLKNYIPETLYVHPGREGAYATLVSEDETLLAEVEVTPRSRLAVSVFYVKDKKDFGTFKLTKLKFHKTYGWQEDGSLQLNNFQLSHLRQFVSLLAALDLSDVKKVRIGLSNIQLETLKTLLASSRGDELLKGLSNAPELHADIYAVAAKREALREFENNLNNRVSEADWQGFFERNTWIFGHGLNYVFLDKVAKKLEATTTGSAFDHAGKRADGLMHTRAEVSQYVLIEIKRNMTELLQSDFYRAGCWAVSDELSSAVTQVQKTTFEFTRNRFRDRQKDGQGNDQNGYLYAVDPKSYLIVGNLSEIAGNDDKIACFELYRRNIRAPEIITFDELYHRAKCIVENISHETTEPSPNNEIPF